jgi:hypothetical protein
VATGPRGEDPALSYLGIRRVIGVAGLALPVVLLIRAFAVDGELHGSMSAYYYTPMRDYFTGTLCVIGVFLFCYRFGRLPFEAWLATVAGLAAVGVAMFHTAPAAGATQRQLHLSYVHLGCATVLFLILGAFSFVVFPSSQSAAEVRGAQAWVYRSLGLAIWVSVVTAGIVDKAASGFYDRTNFLFWMETVAVLAFSVSFLLKGRFLHALRRVSAPAGSAGSR